jgi:hypothetical protein
MNLLVIILLILAALGVAIFFVGKFLRNVQPTNAEVKEDLKELKAAIAPFAGGFVQWERNVIELLPTPITPINAKVETKMGVTTAQGLIVTANNEPLLAYSYKRYIAPGINAVMYAINSNHEFVFRFTNNGIEVLVDNVKIGKIRKNSEFYDLQNNLAATFNATQINSLQRPLAQLPAANQVGMITVSDNLSAQDDQLLQVLFTFGQLLRTGLED